MQLGYVGINYKNTDLSVRDKITFTDSGIADFMQQAEEAGVKQCMLKGTCTVSHLLPLLHETGCCNFFVSNQFDPIRT